MNIEELETLVRAELRAEAANRPPAAAVRAAVLDAVAGLAPAERPGRRWVVPLLVAAAVVALAVAATLLPRAIGRHSQPARPHPTPTVPLPAAPVPTDLACAAGQRLVTGLGARFTDAAHQVGYAYEYFCAGSDGSRTGSQLEWFRMVGGRLVHQPTSLTLAGGNQYLMSLTGTDGGLLARVYDADPGLAGHPGGVVLDYHLQVDAGAADGKPIAQPCLAADLTVRVADVYEPKQHEALQLINHSGKACAVWGNPRYLQTAGTRHASSLPMLVGELGGLGNEPAAPPLLLQPGELASAAIGAMPVASCQVVPASVVLPNGVQLGKLDYGLCLGEVVSYPLVRGENGSETHPELKAPASATGSCLASRELSFGSVRYHAGNRGAMAITISALSSTPCTIAGYPDIRVTDEDRNLQRYPFPAQTLRGPLGGLAGNRLPQVTVAPGHPATALVEWSQDPAAGRCESGGVLWLTLDTPRAGSGPLPSRVCAIQVHPFVPGTTGSG